MSDAIEAHYTSNDLGRRLLDAIESEGQEVDPLDPEVLTALEELHVLGRDGTVALADAATIGPSDRVVDLGSGLGGPARYLARVRGCSVVGVDLTAELCQVAEDLNRRCGLADRVEVRQGSILELPFEDGSFSDASSNHLVPGEEVRRLVEQAGFTVTVHEDPTEAGTAWFHELVAGPPPGPLGPQVVIPGFAEKVANLVAAFDDGRVRLLRLVATA